MNELQKTYANMTNSEIVRIARYEADQLIPQALAILKDELRKRNLLDERMSYLLECQTKEYSEFVIDSLIRKFQHTACPLCQMDKSVNAYSSRCAYGLVAISVIKTHTIIGCPDCVEHCIRQDSMKSCWSGLLAATAVFQIPYVLLRNHL